MIAILNFLTESNSIGAALSKVEVYLDEQQINNLKSILTQSEHGIHVLFENSLIAQVFKNEYPEEKFFEVENIKHVQDDILKLLQLKTLGEKQSYISSLGEVEKHRIVRAYFYIIENNLRTHQKLPH